jgi:hypothetical protein
MTKLTDKVMSSATIKLYNDRFSTASAFVKRTLAQLCANDPMLRGLAAVVLLLGSCIESGNNKWMTLDIVSQSGIRIALLEQG